MRLLGLLVVALSLPATTRLATASPPPAAPPSPAPAATPAPTGDPARDHYERGLAKYNLAEFDAAIAEFKQSYELSKAPRLLFNIAQAYRLKKEYESALYFYNSYLRAEPNPPNISDVEERIDEMKRALDEQRKHNETVGPVTPPPPPPPPPDRRPSKRTLKIAGLTTGVVGLAAIGVGAGMLGLSSSDASTLRRVVTNGDPWSPANDATYREGASAQTAGIALISIGGALVVAGGVTLVIALRR